VYFVEKSLADEPPIKREIESYRDIQAQVRDRIVSERGLAIFCADGVLPPTNRVTRCFGAVVAGMQAATVLDLGCGTGFLALIASRFADRVIGVDIDPRAVACARRNAAMNGVANVRFVVGDGYGPVAGQRFDLIISNPPFYPVSGITPSPTPLCVDPQHPLLDALILGIPTHLEPDGQALFVTSSLSDNTHVERMLSRCQLEFSCRLLHRGLGVSQDILLWRVVA
jgi:methylase of polypeptide subunit release factors